jgi:hypothetical protein
MYGKIYRIALGFSLIVFGFLIIIEPIQYDSKFDRTFDFSSVRWTLGPIMLLIGIGITIYTIKQKADKYEPNVMKCPKCYKRYYNKKNDICSVCNVKLENLKGFYERHPAANIDRNANGVEKRNPTKE